MSKLKVHDRLAAIRTAFREGQKYTAKGGPTITVEDELEYVLDSAFMNNVDFWHNLVEGAGQEAVDAAFYVGTLSKLGD